MSITCTYSIDDFDDDLWDDVPRKLVCEVYGIPFCSLMYHKC